MSTTPHGRTGDDAALLDVRDLCVRFRPGPADPAVAGLSFSVRLGQTLAIVGESGAGKTAGCRAIMGLLPRAAEVTGSARFSGTDLLGLTGPQLRRYRGAELAMVFQDPARALNPTMRSGTQVTEAIRAHLPLGRRAAADRAIELMGMVRIPQPRRRFGDYPHQLSGGMRQRLMIAMAIACRPRLLIADEPTTSLDATTQVQIMELLLSLQAELGMALILITHNLALAACYSADTAVMHAGAIIEQAPTRRLFADARMPYTRALLAGIPQLPHPAPAEQAGP